MTDTKRTLNRERPKQDVAPTETIRTRLGLTKEEFAKALGVGSGNAYNMYLKAAQMPVVVALAAEALMRRQAAVTDVTFMITIVKGAPKATLVDGAQEMTLGGKRYMLVEKGA